MVVVQAKIAENEVTKIEYMNGKLFLASRTTNTIVIHEEGLPVEQFTPFGS